MKQADLDLWPSALLILQPSVIIDKAEQPQASPTGQNSPEHLGMGEKCIYPTGTGLLNFAFIIHQSHQSVCLLFWWRNNEVWRKGAGSRNSFRKPDQVPIKESGLSIFIKLPS